MMLYAPSVVSNGPFKGQVIARTASSPTGPWSNAVVLGETGRYAPYMLPYLTFDHSTVTGPFVTSTYKAYYVASIFTPYSNELRSFDVSVTERRIIVCPRCG